ncbi:MAG: wax ester/triacylglycerol synthase family O-acyltransferase [Xanthomonadales bacterium]|nr:wax ester/triacylglycerol synthase family O-acyltransferase [Xanthomonadales bacterium]
MKRLSLLDSNFLIAENRETPMHVGGVSLYSYPKGVNKGKFLRELREIMVSSADLRAPFNQRLTRNLLSRANLVFHWQQDRNLDLDYHVRHSALPKPGRYRELFTLISRLHSTLLDRNRPLWEMHLIEGISGNQFAMYLKTHHCMMDGIASMQMAQCMLSDSPEGWVDYSPLSREAWESYKRGAEKPAQISRADIHSLADRIGSQIDSGSQLAKALLKFGNVWLGGSRPLNVPWHAVPHSIISSRVSGSRRFVAQTWPYARIRAVGKALEGTFNDAVLAMCAGALRCYLVATGELPTMPLKAMVPISLRREGDLESANALGFIIANLATQIEDPAERFHAIRQSVLAGKKVYAGLGPGEAALFTQLTMSPLLITNLLGAGQLLPAYNLVISNVPGPRSTRYWNGARLDGIYPASIVLHGQAMNITLVSYGDHVDFGIIACRKSLPSVQRLLDFLEESLQELEEVSGLR